jgi:hypothetical protein
MTTTLKCLAPLCLIFFAAVLLPGCSGALQPVKAKGKLFYTPDGKPLPRVTVQLHAGGKQEVVASGETNEQGEFSLSVQSETGEEPGVVPGHYKVTLKTYPGSPTVFPEACKYPDRTKLSIDIPKGGSENLEVKVPRD